MKYGIVVFPGSNCDHDAYWGALKTGGEPVFLWHKDTQIPHDVDCVILPGGFSYGDYLRCGAIARFSPIMREVVNFAGKGKLVIGICNGFQILTEAELLPGTLLMNESLTFLCRDTTLRVMNNKTAFTNQCSEGQVLTIPIAHNEGNYFAEPETIARLEGENRILFKYATPEGVVVPEACPNGAINNIAGIVNEKGNVLGMMPHPERYCDSTLKHTDGTKVFESIIHFLNKKG